MNIINYLSRIRDFRRKQGLRYPLIMVLLITIMSIMAGRCRQREIASFARANQTELTKFFKVRKNRIPSHVTFREVLRNVDFEELISVFDDWAAQYVTLEKDEWLSIDGKALASTVTDSQSSYQNFVSLVSIFSHRRGQVLKAAKLENKKQSEIPTVRELIETLELKGVVFTLDALRCQKKTTQVITKSGNGYVIQVKGNQPKLFGSLREIAETQEPISTFLSDECPRGRQEKRITNIFPVPSHLSADWSEIRRLIHVERLSSKNGESSHTHHYYISSLSSDNAETFAKGIRGHRSIGNRLHWVKDVIQHEDSSGIRKGNGIGTLSILKNMAINFCRGLGSDSIKEAGIHFSSNVKELLAYFRT